MKLTESCCIPHGVLFKLLVMDKFERAYNLFDDSVMVDLEIPPICCNRICGIWSSPSYCYERFRLGKEDHPVCVRSAILFNRKLLPLPKQLPVQLKLF